MSRGAESKATAGEPLVARLFQNVTYHNATPPSSEMADVLADAMRSTDKDYSTEGQAINSAAKDELLNLRQMLDTLDLEV